MANLVWRCSVPAYERYLHIKQQLTVMTNHYSEEAIVLIDELRSLPNFPPMREEDTLIPIPESKPFSIGVH